MKMKKLISFITAIACVFSVLCVMPSLAENEYLTNKAEWESTGSSYLSEDQNPSKAVDGDITSKWHTKVSWGDGGAVIPVPCPHNLDITLPKATTISGFSIVPRQDISYGHVLQYEIYASDSDDGEWVLAYRGDNIGTRNKERRDVVFEANITVKRLRFSATKAADGYIVISEFDLIKENKDLETVGFAELAEIHDGVQPVELPKNEFVATSDSVWTANHMGKNVVDGSWDYYWHSNPADRYNTVSVKIDMKYVYNFSAIRYYPRNSGDLEGGWEEFNIKTSIDGVNWETPIVGVGFETNHDMKYLDLGKVLTGRYVEFEITKGYLGYAACGELDFLVLKKDQAIIQRPEYTLKIGSNVINFKEEELDKDTVIDVAPYIKNDSTLIPLRSLLTEMGATILWDDKTQKIDISYEGKRIEMQVMNNQVYVTDKYGKRVRYIFNVIPEIKEGRTFIPLRFVSEHLEWKVDWNAETQEIKILR